jgi:hypothetical protein
LDVWSCCHTGFEDDDTVAAPTTPPIPPDEKLLRKLPRRPRAGVLLGCDETDAWRDVVLWWCAAICACRSRNQSALLALVSVYAMKDLVLETTWSGWIERGRTEKNCERK